MSSRGAFARPLGHLFQTGFGGDPSTYDAEARVLEGVQRANFRARAWERILRHAAIGHWSLKDLRSTYASQLLTCGVQLGRVQRQLGHATPMMTATAYARWIERGEYREPMRLRERELPCDLLDRLDQTYDGVAPTTGRPDAIAFP